MATCPSCQRKVSVLFNSFRPSVMLGNVPTLLVMLFLFSQVAGLFVEFEKAGQ